MKVVVFVCACAFACSSSLAYTYTYLGMRQAQVPKGFFGSGLATKKAHRSIAGAPSRIRGLSVTPRVTASLDLSTRRRQACKSGGAVKGLRARSGYGGEQKIATGTVTRTNDDKRKAVMTLLKDAEWGKWSNAEIARRCCVDSSTVDKYRGPSLPKSGSEQKTYTDKHGNTTTMNTDNIGRASGREQRRATRHERR